MVRRSVGAGGLLFAFVRRRPAASLIVLVVLGMVLPLAPDLFMAVPWPYRKGLGQGIFVALVAALLRRVWRVGPRDLRPIDDRPRAGYWALVPPLLCACLAVPLLRHPENMGLGDWDLNLHKYEAVRRTIVEWGEFPWWDPWCRGGFPLAANPQCGVFGVATPLVLAFGTSVGMRLAAIACLAIATEGARRLSSLWVADGLASLAAGVIYGLNGGVLVQVVAGYHLPMSYCAFPWLLYYTFRLDRRLADGAWLGFWLAFNVLNGINYHSVYACLIGAVVWLRAGRLCPPGRRGRFLAHSLFAAGVCLALAGWRIATTGLVYRDFPRFYISFCDETPRMILGHLLDRPRLADLVGAAPYFWESTCYVGPVVVLLAAVSLVWGWRWWHTLAAVCGWLASGSGELWHPSYWLADLPLFASMHVVTRWRIMALLGLALAVADVVDRARRSGSRPVRLMTLAVVAIVGIDFVQLGMTILPLAFSVEPGGAGDPPVPTPTVVQVGDGSAFAAVVRGHGVIRQQEPLLGYDPTAPTRRRWLGDPDYCGEFWTPSGPVDPLSWSPNRMAFRLRPGELLTINQNPGSWWLVNGREEFPRWKCAETMCDFLVRADAHGGLNLRVRPRGLEFGWLLHLAGLTLVAGVLGVSRLLGAPSRARGGAPVVVGIRADSL